MATILMLSPGCACCGPPDVPCTPCPLPQADLTISWAFTSFPASWGGGASGSETAVFDMVNTTWSGDCHDHSGSSKRFVLNCGGVGNAELDVNAYSYPACAYSPTSVIAYISPAGTCSPAHLDYTLTGTSGGFVGHVYFDE